LKVYYSFSLLSISEWAPEQLEKTQVLNLGL